MSSTAILAIAIGIVVVLAIVLRMVATPLLLLARLPAFAGAVLLLGRPLLAGRLFHLLVGAQAGLADATNPDTDGQAGGLLSGLLAAELGAGEVVLVDERGGLDARRIELERRGAERHLAQRVVVARLRHDGGRRRRHDALLPRVPRAARLVHALRVAGARHGGRQPGQVTAHRHARQGAGKEIQPWQAGVALDVVGDEVDAGAAAEPAEPPAG